MIKFGEEKELYYRKIRKICYVLQQIFICNKIIVGKTADYGMPHIHFQLIKGNDEYNTLISYEYFDDLSIISIVGYLSNEFIGLMSKKIVEEQKL